MLKGLPGRHIKRFAGITYEKVCHPERSRGISLQLAGNLLEALRLALLSQNNRADTKYLIEPVGRPPYQRHL